MISACFAECILKCFHQNGMKRFTSQMNSSFVSFSTWTSFALTWTKWGAKRDRCRPTCLSLFINQISFLREIRLMRRLFNCSITSSRFYARSCELSEDSLQPNADGKPNLLLSCVWKSHNETCPRSSATSVMTTGVCARWELAFQWRFQSRQDEPWALMKEKLLTHTRRSLGNTPSTLINILAIFGNAQL